MSSGSDKRQVATDALETLGTIIGPKQKRDAIHLAVEPVMAARMLNPGEHVVIREGKAYPTIPFSPGAHGIVDPFLSSPVNVGEWFWFVMYPRMVHSLRHVWSHPAFPDELPELRERNEPKSKPTPAESEAWLREFISYADCPDYNTVIAAATGEKAPNTEYYGRAWRNDGEYLHFKGRDAHGEIPPEFWDHVENVTGKKITTRPAYFSCSC